MAIDTGLMLSDCKSATWSLKDAGPLRKENLPIRDVEPAGEVPCIIVLELECSSAIGCRLADGRRWNGELRGGADGDQGVGERLASENEDSVAGQLDVGDLDEWRHG